MYVYYDSVQLILLLHVHLVKKSINLLKGDHVLEHCVTPTLHHKIIGSQIIPIIIINIRVIKFCPQAHLDPEMPCLISPSPKRVKGEWEEGAEPGGECCPAFRVDWDAGEEGERGLGAWRLWRPVGEGFDVSVVRGAAILTCNWDISSVGGEEGAICLGISAWVLLWDS